MRRFFVEEIDPHGSSFVIKDPEARHITRVLRMGRGDRLVLMDRSGARYLALIESVRSHEVTVILEEALPPPGISPVEIILCQALLKSGPMDLVIQKTSELGVTRIIPFSSQRTVVTLTGKNLTNRWRHWKEIARASTKQADRMIPADMDTPCSLQAF